MCDYGDYIEIRSGEVITRKPHVCTSCDKPFPAGTRMLYHFGRFEGELSDGYTCKACRFAYHQEDDTPLHLCHGWGHDVSGYDNPRETWAYIDYCLTNGEPPTITGLGMALAQHRQLEGAP